MKRWNITAGHPEMVSCDYIGTIEESDVYIAVDYGGNVTYALISSNRPLARGYFAHVGSLDDFLPAEHFSQAINDFCIAHRNLSS